MNHTVTNNGIDKNTIINFNKSNDTSTIPTTLTMTILFTVIQTLPPMLTGVLLPSLLSLQWHEHSAVTLQYCSDTLFDFFYLFKWTMCEKQQLVVVLCDLLCVWQWVVGNAKIWYQGISLQGRKYQFHEGFPEGWAFHGWIQGMWLSFLQACLHTFVRRSIL